MPQVSSRSGVVTPDDHHEWPTTDDSAPSFQKSSDKVNWDARWCWLVVTVTGYSVNEGSAFEARVAPVSPKYESNVLFSARIITTCVVWGVSELPLAELPPGVVALHRTWLSALPPPGRPTDRHGCWAGSVVAAPASKIGAS